MGKIKLFIESEKGKDVLIIIIVILVGLASFELGRLSRGKQSSGVKIEYPKKDVYMEANIISGINSSEKNQTSKSNAISSSKNFFASNRGSKYYPVGCSGGQNINQENRIYFNTSTEAENAGYILSSSCR